MNRLYFIYLIIIHNANYKDLCMMSSDDEFAEKEAKKKVYEYAKFLVDSNRVPRTFLLKVDKKYF